MKNINVGIITQARIGSTRLPAKTLLSLGSETVLGMHLRRLKQSGFDVYLATTFEDRSSELIAIAGEHDIPVWQGSSDDVLSRYYTCAKKYKIDVIVRVTSDCPLICPDLVHEGVEAFLALENWESSYVSNTQTRYYPRGMDFEIFSFSQLERAHLNCLDLGLREHVTPYLYLQNQDVNQVVFKSRNFDKDRSDWRITLDTQSDFLLISKLVDEFSCDQMKYHEISTILDRESQLKMINIDIEQKKIKV